MPETFAELEIGLREPGGALPRRAGHRVHDRRRAALDAANPLGQAHDRGRNPHRRRHGGGGPPQPRGGGAARGRGWARPAAASHDRSCRGEGRHCHRPACFSGAAAGEIVFDADEAEALKGKGRQVILVRAETSPEDIHGMHAAVGILTARGGMTSHAAVVARGMGRPCIRGGHTPHRCRGRDNDGRQRRVPYRRRHHDRRQYRPCSAAVRPCISRNCRAPSPRS